MFANRDWLLVVMTFHVCIKKKTYQFRIVERRGRFYACKFNVFFIIEQIVKMKDYDL